MRKVLVVAMLAVALSAGSAFAAEKLSYNFAQASYVDAEFDSGPDGDGVSLFGVGEVSQRFHLFGMYETIEFDGGLLGDADFDTLQAGFGYHRDLGDRASFYGRVSYVDVDVDTIIGSGSDDGFGLTAGARGLISPKVELNAELAYVDLGDIGDDTTLGFNAFYNATEKFSVGLGYRTSDLIDAFNVSLRFYWGER